MLKVLHIINSLQPGGAEILLVNSLRKENLPAVTENHLAYFSAPSYLLERVDGSVKIHDLNYKGIKSIPALLRNIRRIIKENKIDIIHTHLNPSGVYTHLACPANIPQVHTMHTTYSLDKETSKLRLWAENFFYLRSKRANLILLSDYARQDLMNSIDFRGKAFVTGNFIEDAFFSVEHAEYHPGNPLKLTAAGTLKPLKNFEYLLDVFSYLKEDDISVDIYGGGDRSKYQSVIEREGLKINMKGLTKEFNKVIGNYDAFIMPSLFEGSPLSVYEAMAAGLPVLLSDIEPLKKMAANEAIFFPLNDSKAVAEIIRNIYSGKTDLHPYVQRGKLLAQQNATAKKYTESLLKIYQLLTEENKSSVIS